MGLSKEPQLAAPSQANLSKEPQLAATSQANLSKEPQLAATSQANQQEPNSPRRQKWGTSEAAMPRAGTAKG
jgi:hypothetical protein